ncbi:MAG: SGNH/GDSL hydrolase family protein [Ignavibacteriales bacterium]|nr:SGNH/GDSL hydrolase family protein [Ignavibacteriales bacterium]
MRLQIFKYFKVLFFNIIVITLLFLFLELCIRILIPEIKLAGTSTSLYTDSVYANSPGLKPNASGFSNGAFKLTNKFRCWNYKRSVSKDSRKILILGDSVTMGLGVGNDSTFTGILNSESDTIDYLNPSLMGYSSEDYYTISDFFLSNNMTGLRINAVQIYWTLNDIYSNYPDKNAPAFSAGDFLFDIVYQLSRNSKAYIFIKNLFSDRPKAYYQYDNQFYVSDNPFFISAMKDLREVILKCQTKNIPISIILLPYEYQIRNLGKPAFFEPQKLIKANLDSIDVELIDCAFAFKDHIKTSNKYYLWGDGIHFSEDGHKLIAEFIKDQKSK